MSQPAIRVENLSKCYRVGKAAVPRAYRTLRETLMSWPQRLFGRATPTETEEFWALKDVSFEVQPGEVVGIIGRNGAGKSTLLKILSRITKPTSGRVELNGRVGSLLEVGTGFHPELTGRENLYLNGSILGMSRREIDRKFDEIVAFAEIDKFLDTPVKHYSSGMYVRLAFAVAAHLEPEILIVDEVLAVGDAGFQQKCLTKMQDVSRQGRTVLLVSHNVQTLNVMARTCVLLECGCVIAHGTTRGVLDKYLDTGVEAGNEWVRSVEFSGNGPVRIQAIRCKNESGQLVGRFTSDRDFLIEFETVVTESVRGQVAFRLLSARDGETVFTSALADATGQRDSLLESGRHLYQCLIPANFLAPGWYSVLAAVNNFYGPGYDLIERALHFEVTEVGSTSCYDNRLGRVMPILKWRANSL